MEPDAADDAELLRAHAAGEPHAFARLYDRHDRASFRFIQRMLGAGRGEAAEDLHQDTWMAVAANAAAFDVRKGGFGAWLFTIARRKVWDYFRRQKMTVLARGEEDEAMRAPDPGPTPLQEVEARQLAERLVAAVEALPLAQREVFIMFADAGLSLEEISGVMDAGVETTKSRLRYARESLRRILVSERPAHV